MFLTRKTSPDSHTGHMHFRNTTLLVSVAAQLSTHVSCVPSDRQALQPWAKIKRIPSE